MLTQIESISNMGGIVEASFIYHSDIDTAYKLPGTHELYIKLKQSKVWTPLYMSPNPEVNEDYDESNELYSPFLKLHYPVKSAIITHQNRLLLARKLIVKVTTSNGHVLYIGTHEFPASFTFKKLIGGSAISYSGYEAIFRSIQKDSMLFATSQVESQS